jgi:hypothetical protein
MTVQRAAAGLTILAGALALAEVRRGTAVEDLDIPWPPQP